MGTSVWTNYRPGSIWSRLTTLLEDENVDGWVIGCFAAHVLHCVGKEEEVDETRNKQAFAKGRQSRDVADNLD